MINSVKRLLSISIAALVLFSLLTADFCFAYASHTEETELYNIQDGFYEADDSAENHNGLFNGLFSALTKSQDLNAYNYLKNYLIANGRKSSSSNSYYIAKITYSAEYEYFFSITYDVEDADLHCGATLLNSTLYMFLTLDSNSADGYKVTSLSVNEEYNYNVHGKTVVFPENYTSSLSFTNYDDYGYLVNNTALDNLLNTAFKLCINEWNDMLETETSINFGDFGFTKLFTPGNSSSNDRYTVSYDANGGSGAPASQTKNTEETLTISDVIPTRYGYNFIGWAANKDAISAEYQPGDLYTNQNNITLYAVWQRDESIEILLPEVKIENNPKIVTVPYYSTVFLTAVSENLPDGATLQWFLNDSTVSSATGVNVYLNNPNQDTVLTVKIIDAQGKPVVDSYGNEIKDSVMIDVETGFFNLIVSFFRFIFTGSNNVII